MSRSAGLAPLEAQVRWVPTGAALAAVLAAAPGPVALTDLTLASWRSGQIGDELRAQLAPGRRFEEDGPEARPGNESGDGEDGRIRAAIDDETRGDGVALDAAACAREILEAAPGVKTTVLVVAPRFGITLSEDDIVFLEVLTAHLGGAADLVFLAADEQPGLPDRWSMKWRQSPAAAVEGAIGSVSVRDGSGLAHLIPGILDPKVLSRLEIEGLDTAAATVALPFGHAAVPPELRRPLSEEPGLRLDRLGVVAREAGTPWLTAFAQVHGNNHFVDGSFLLEEARRQLATASSAAVPLRLLGRAAECARTRLERQILEAHAQSIRIAARRFDEAATVAGPPDGLPADLSAALLQAKGWGLVMSGWAAEGEEYLRAASGAMVSGSPPARLYLANITALARMRVGDLKEALAIECDIENALVALDVPHRHLEYVNHLNLARLHRRLGNWSTAEEHFARAFATVDGLRSESDALYANANLARLYDEAGNVEASLLAWLRAALHHLSGAAPEAVAPRVATAIVGGPCGRGPDAAAAVAAGLERRLERAARGAGLGLAAQAPVPRFVGAGALPKPAGACLRVEGGPGWGVARFRGDGRERRANPSEALASLTWAVLLEFGAAPGSGEDEVVVVDDRQGREIATTAAELLETALRLGAPQLAFAGRRVELPAPLRRRLRAASEVRRGPGVEDVRPHSVGMLVSFKRYRRACLVTGDAGRIVAAADPGARFGRLLAVVRECVHASKVAALVEDMERRRILVRVPPPDAPARLDLSAGDRPEI